MNAAEDDPGALRPGEAADLVAAVRIGGVNADADDVAGRDGREVEGFERFVDQVRVAVLAGVAAART